MTLSTTASQAPSVGADGIEIRPFHFDAPRQDPDDLRQRIQATRWPDKETVADDTQGVQLATMRSLADHWATRHDWRRAEAAINALPHYVTQIDGLDIHFIHVRSQHEGALP